MRIASFSRAIRRPAPHSRLSLSFPFSTVAQSSTPHYSDHITPSHEPQVFDREQIVDSCKDHTIWTWSAQKSVDPIAISRAEGVHFWDFNGKKYIDMNSQLMCSNLGHQHPKIIEAIKRQADELCFASPAFATRTRAEFGPLLAKFTPGDLDHFFFTLGGAESNENAIKFAKQYTGRHKLIVRYRSYHGATHATGQMTGDRRRFAHEMNGMGGVIRVFDPYIYRSLMYKEGMTEEEFSTVMVKQLEETILAENPDSIAAMFLETVTGTNGIIIPPRGYLQGVREVLSKYGIIMICDEVMCGLGRTGEWFACNHWDVVPDIITMAKGVTSGYMPLGVVAVNSEIASYFDDTPFVGGLTYSGHPMCLATGVACLKTMQEENIVARAKETGAHMKKKMQALKEKHVSVGDVRCIGLFGCFELIQNTRTKEPLVLNERNAPHPAFLETCVDIRTNGVFTHQHINFIHCNPPLTITKEEIDEAFEVFDKALDIADAAVKE